MCQKHRYFQIFFEPEKASHDFKVMEDRELTATLRHAYKLDSNEALQHGSPLLLSSLNNWVLTRLLDVRVFTQLLKHKSDGFIENEVK